jgi:hypothetical protein
VSCFALSCLALCCLVLLSCCVVLPCLVVLCRVVSYRVVLCLGLACLVLLCLVLSWLDLTWLGLAWLGLSHYRRAYFPFSLPEVFFENSFDFVCEVSIIIIFFFHAAVFSFACFCFIISSDRCSIANPTTCAENPGFDTQKCRKDKTRMEKSY